MLIIFEGPDGAGKTTLVRETADLIGQHAPVSVLHAGPPTRHPIDEYEVPLAHYRPNTHHIICDRWHLGEAIYPQVLNRKTKWNIAIQRHINLFLRSRGACVVLLKPSRKELMLRLAARGDDFITMDQLNAITLGYAQLPSYYFSHRYMRGSDKSIPTPRGIVQLARRMHLTAAALNLFETYVGPPKPSILLLGDERAPAARHRQPDLPAFVPYPATSGHYLLTHFDPRGTVGLANACDADDPLKLWLTLNSPNVVTLGRRATERANELCIPHGSVPHPQFIRRFHTQHGDEYAHLIRAVAQSGEDMLSWRP
jgi:hypothetical protein